MQFCLLVVGQQVGLLVHVQLVVDLVRVAVTEHVKLGLGQAPDLVLGGISNVLNMVCLLHNFTGLYLVVEYPPEQQQDHPHQHQPRRHAAADGRGDVNRARHFQLKIFLSTLKIFLLH